MPTMRIVIANITYKHTNIRIDIHINIHVNKLLIVVIIVVVVAATDCNRIAAHNVPISIFNGISTLKKQTEKIKIKKK